MQQKMIVTMGIEDDGKLGLTMEFEPTLVNDKEKFGELTDDERVLQNYASLVGNAVINEILE